ncbi:MAG: YceI family protein [Chlorobi bacterium]|nr:YceI family protein [Chlorobiota bacterium]
MVGLLILPAFTQQTKWTFDKAHSKIGFTVVHMVISEVSGSFGEFSGKVYSDTEDFTDARVELSISTSSVNTGNDRRDNHLRSADFFNVEKFPEITFKSSAMKKVGDRKYKLEGDFTMHGVTRKVVLDASLGGVIKDPYGRTRAGFKVTGTLNRKDFGLTWNNTLESGGVVISDEVKLNCSVELVREK